MLLYQWIAQLNFFWGALVETFKLIFLKSLVSDFLNKVCQSLVDKSGILLIVLELVL